MFKTFSTVVVTDPNSRHYCRRGRVLPSTKPYSDERIVPEGSVLVELSNNGNQMGRTDCYGSLTPADFEFIFSEDDLSRPRDFFPNFDGHAYHRPDDHESYRYEDDEDFGDLPF